MIRSLHILDSGFIYNLIFITILVIVSQFFAQNIIAGKSLQLVSMMFGSALVITILKRPINGLIILPFVSYLIPYELQVTGGSIFSPGLLISAITLFSAAVQISLARLRPNINWLWILVLAIAINMIIVTTESSGIGFLKNLLIGFVPFVLFSLVVNTESDGRRVLKYWLIAYACFAIIHLARGGITFSDQSLLQGFASVRTAALGGHNPNTLGWMGLLFLPLAPVIAIASSKREKWKWWLVFFSMVPLLIFSFSRSTMVGMLLTFGLLSVFLIKRAEGSIRIMIPLLISILAIYILWTMAFANRFIPVNSIESVFPELEVRWSWMVKGWRLFALQPLTGAGLNVDDYEGHSGFTKAAVEYGLFFFLLHCTAYIYFIKTSYFVSKVHLKPHVRLFALGMLVAGIVAALQNLFGITLFSAKYSQVFWLFIGYLYLARREITLAKIKLHQI